MECRLGVCAGKEFYSTASGLQKFGRFDFAKDEDGREVRSPSKIERDDARWAEEESMAIKIENDFLHNGITDPNDSRFRWNGPTGHEPKPKFTPEQLAALRASAPAPKPTFAEKMAARAAAAKKVQ
jgi:hypothetical protein